MCALIAQLIIFLAGALKPIKTTVSAIANAQAQLCVFNTRLADESTDLSGLFVKSLNQNIIMVEC